MKADEAAGRRERTEIHGKPCRKRQQCLQTEKRVPADERLQFLVEGQILNIQEQIAGTRRNGTGSFQTKQRDFTE